MNEERRKRILYFNSDYVYLLLEEFRNYEEEINGIQVLATADQDRCIEMVIKEPFDLVAIHHNSVYTISVARELKRIRPNLPLLSMSGSIGDSKSEREIYMRGAREGVEDFPFDDVIPKISDLKEDLKSIVCWFETKTVENA